MTSAFMSRRGLMRGIALAAALPLASGKAFGAASAVPDRRVAATAALLKAAFPHRGLTPGFYLGAAETYVKEIAAQPAAISEHDRGLALLDASHIAPFADLPPVIQKGLVEKVDQEPFFKAILWRGAELIYRDRSVWKMVGYEGSSLEYGGYHDRGFDDIDWLPKAGSSGA
ncbi:hypothetical protein [Rhizorhabdus sp. FW153]|uniref:hypothetical protein n=1 Tax=Rhizorhabdus sp. FW153 TaxID=3400216 RepID=UPI003CEAE433